MKAWARRWTSILTLGLPVAMALLVLDACDAVLGIGDYHDRVGDAGESVDGSVGDAADASVGDAAGASDSSVEDAIASDAPAMECEAGTTRCGGSLGNIPQSCLADGGSSDGIECAAVCSAGACITPPSCAAGVTGQCGSGGTQSCCAATLVPAGTFDRSYDRVTATDPSYGASVSSLLLDRFEVTVGRFRNFTDGYVKPASGAGKNPHYAGDPGWDVAFPLPADATALKAEVACSMGTWTATAGANERLPITCVDWYTAFAFCIWDGGRLPTEAEWNYAASGGGDAAGQRVYPWSSPATSQTVSSTNAVFNVGAALAVGTKSPAGDGRYGHSDLSGNAEEWVLDWYSSPYPSTSCTDCATTTGSGSRVLRGANFASAGTELTASRRDSAIPATRIPGVGFRCARPYP